MACGLSTYKAIRYETIRYKAIRYKARDVARKMFLGFEISGAFL